MGVIFEKADEGFGTQTPSDTVSQAQSLLDPTSSMEKVMSVLKRGGEAALSAAGDVGLALGQGLTFGTYDEVMGFVDSITKGIPLDQAIEAYRKPLEKFREEAPVIAYGSEMMASLPYLPKSIPSAVGLGAGYGFGAAEGDPVERLPETVMGGLIGGGLQKIVPAGVTPTAKELRGRGVPLTAGQTLGGTSKTLEEAFTSVPIVGEAIKSQQRKGLKAFNVATINEALKPLGKQLPMTLDPSEAAKRANKIFDEAYRKTLSPIKLKVDDAFIKKVISTVDEYDLPDAERKEVIDTITRSFVERAKKAEGGVLTGQMIREIKTSLGETGQMMRVATGDYSYQKSQAYTDASNAIMDAVADKFPKQAAELKKIGTAYSRYAPVIDAMFKSKQEGLFTPAQLLSQVQRQSRGSKRTYIEGEGRQQKLAEAGMETLAQKLPETGTGLRSYLTGGLLSGGVGAIDPTAGILSLGAMGTGAMAYTPAVQSLLRGISSQRIPMTTKRTPPVGGVLTTAAKMGRSPAAAGLLGGYIGEDYMNVAP